MTQASLSQDRYGPLSAPPSNVDLSARPAAPSETALWMVAVTSSSLVVAAVMLLALLLNNVVRDPSLGGFVSGIGIVIAALGLGGVTYSLVTARRAGYLVAPQSTRGLSSTVPGGMHVVPALPADLGRQKRRQLEAERSARSRQAKAIATAAVVAQPSPRPVAPPPAKPRPAARAQPVARRQPVARPRPKARQGQNRVPQRAPVRAAQTTPARMRPAPVPARPVPAPARVAPALVMRPTPVTPTVRAQAPTRPAITMPRPQARQPRPAAWPNRAPVVRMAAPPMRPRTQVTTFQVNAANVRAAVPLPPRR